MAKAKELNLAATKAVGELYTHSLELEKRNKQLEEEQQRLKEELTKFVDVVRKHRPDLSEASPYHLSRALEAELRELREVRQAAQDSGYKSWRTQLRAADQLGA